MEEYKYSRKPGSGQNILQEKSRTESCEYQIVKIVVGEKI